MKQVLILTLVFFAAMKRVYGTPIMRERSLCEEDVLDRRAALGRLAWAIRCEANPDVREVLEEISRNNSILIFPTYAHWVPPTREAQGRFTNPRRWFAPTMESAAFNLLPEGFARQCFV